MFIRKKWFFVVGSESFKNAESSLEGIGENGNFGFFMADQFAVD